MNTPASLERIEQLRGMDEFKALAQRLKRVSDNKRNLPMSRIQLPNYLFIEAPGCGVTTHIRMLTDLLQELGLMRFEGDRKYFEWVLGLDAFEKGGAFEGLLDRINLMAGFHSSYRGVVGLEIDGWQKKAESAEFTRLMDLVEDKLGEILFVFIVQPAGEEDPADLIRCLSAVMPLEVVHCPLPSPGDMALYLGDFLRRRHFRVSLGALEALKGMMPKLIAAKAFDGFQTLDNLADEIVYRYCAAEERRDSQLIGPKDLAFIAEPGGYIDRLSVREERPARRQIGF